jgi:hypothetical protein
MHKWPVLKTQLNDLIVNGQNLPRNIVTYREWKSNSAYCENGWYATIIIDEPTRVLDRRHTATYNLTKCCVELLLL